MSAGSAQNARKKQHCVLCMLDVKVGLTNEVHEVWLEAGIGWYLAIPCPDLRTKKRPSFDAPECFARQFSDSLAVDKASVWQAPFNFFKG